MDWTLKNAAFAVPLQCTKGTNPWSAISFSRRSVMGVSLGHFIATSPSSVLKECTGSPSTSPPLSTPRIVAHQPRSEEHTSELQSLTNLVCRLLLEKKNKKRQEPPRNVRQQNRTTCCRPHA